jgi:hypothetical protein
MGGGEGARTGGAEHGPRSLRPDVQAPQPITGTFQANVKDATLKTLADMLQRTAQAQVRRNLAQGTRRPAHGRSLESPER